MSGVAVLLIALTACEAIESDYQGMFGEDPVPERITGPTAADRDAPEPNLASVPRHHPKYQSSAVREDQRADLEADIKRAEYSTVPPQVNIDRDQAARPATDGQVTPGKGELLGIIQFAEGSAKLDDRDRAILRQVVALREERGGRIRLVGHASRGDQAGGPAEVRLANFITSAERARSVATALTGEGLPRTDLLVEAEGDNRPLYAETEASGAAANRRVEIFLVK
jgi:outer membrane protein OmpA-like peptidoglycan-associated protein